MSAESDTVIRLEQFLKRIGVVGSGGQAKVAIQAGLVKVNGKIDTRRRRQLKHGDTVEWEGRSYDVCE